MPGEGGHAEADRECERVGGEGLPDLAAHALGEDVGGVVIGVRRDHRELLAADPGGGVHSPLRLLEDLAELLQGAVAGGVAVAVVDRLEAVEVADDHR